MHLHCACIALALRLQRRRRPSSGKTTCSRSSRVPFFVCFIMFSSTTFRSTLRFQSPNQVSVPLFGLSGPLFFKLFSKFETTQGLKKAKLQKGGALGLSLRITVVIRVLPPELKKR
jgi:hypothetical protein